MPDICPYCGSSDPAACIQPDLKGRPCRTAKCIAAQVPTLLAEASDMSGAVTFHQSLCGVTEADLWHLRMVAAVLRRL